MDIQNGGRVSGYNNGVGGVDTHNGGRGSGHNGGRGSGYNNGGRRSGYIKWGSEEWIYIMEVGEVDIHNGGPGSGYT